MEVIKMKTKRDFVTNSSSTSFIVSDYRENKEKLLVEYDWGTVDLLKVLSHDTFTSLEELIDVIDEDDSEIEIFKEVFKKGGTIHLLHAYDTGGGSENPLEAGFCNMGISDAKVPKGVEILRGEGGY
jgi:hypothetical protein